MVKETDIAAPVVEWLSEQGWEVFQEVQPFWGGRVADIVGRFITAEGNTLIWVIEVKKSLSLALLEQAVRWSTDANFVSIAVPYSRRTRRPGRILSHIFKHFSLGLLEVAPDGPYITVKRAPGLNRHREEKRLRWDKVLTEDQKTFAAAGSQGGYWTPFKQTSTELVRYVKSHEGCTLKEAIQSFPHHYANDKSAICSLRTWIQKGVIKGIQIKADGRMLRLYKV